MTRSDEDRLTERPAAVVSDLRELAPTPSGVQRPIDNAVLERLFDLAVALPVEEGSHAVVRVYLDRLSELLPTIALGVCLVDPSAGGRLVDLRLPEGVDAGTEHDPSRLFPALLREQIVRLGESLTGSTFHLGSDEASGIPEAARGILTRAVPLLEQALVRARSVDRTQTAGSAIDKLQAQLIQNEKLASLGQIVAGVVHELNNPLTSIVAYADFLKRRLETRGETDDVERAQRIAEAAHRILRFSRDLVAYARPSGDTASAVLLPHVIDKALVFCEHELEKSGVRVERRWHVEGPLVMGISGQLTQIFVNLFTNAAHAMSDGGGTLTITTSVGLSADRVSITVDDDGAGIDPEHVDQVFEPFFTTKTEGRGTGLGLSIVRDIVNAHGGSVRVTSILGQGTAFLLELPAAVRRASTRPPGL
ncbi:MAG: GHKL domain-containing protein [Myxococcales bacterium]|nr:GHKL domain-containing protein [Myxococcales bacterium]